MSHSWFALLDPSTPQGTICRPKHVVPPDPNGDPTEVDIHIGGAVVQAADAAWKVAALMVDDGSIQISVYDHADVQVPVIYSISHLARSVAIVHDTDAGRLEIRLVPKPQ